LSSLEVLRWSGSFALVVAVHAGAVAVALEWPEPPRTPDAFENPPVVMLEMAPLAAVPPAVEEEVPPGPDLSEIIPEPEPPPPVEVPPMPMAMLSAPELRPAEPKKSVSEPVEKKAEKKPPQRRTAPQAEPRAAPVAAAPSADVTPQPQSAAMPTWKGMLLRHLERHKRYPPEAQRARYEGITYIRFVMNRDGRVLFASIEKPAGVAVLDQEGLDLLQRAQPLPSLPPDQPGETLALIVPIQFYMRR
jgi:periplasmic protein TonB